MSGAQAVELVGGERCQATLDVASKRLGDLSSPAAKASATVAVAARARAPRLTGALIASTAPAAEGNNAAVRVGVRYGWPVESGVPSRRIPARPFVAEATEATEPLWTTYYSGQVDKVIGEVKGA